MTPRERLQGGSYASLPAMVEAYATEAVRTARAEFHETLRYDVPSLERVERILNRLSPWPEPLPVTDADWLTLLWGSWFGELLRALHGGAWSMTPYPGSDFSVPTIELPAAREDAMPSRLYPMMKVHRRLTLGAAESLPAFYAMVEARVRVAPSAAPHVPE